MLHVLALMPLALCGADLRVGIVGTDSSHSTAFTEILNDPSAHGHVPGARVVAVYKTGSPDIEKSAAHMEKYAQELTSKWGLETVADIPALCSKVDAIMVLTVDGRAHLGQAKQVFACHKPVYIDKPLAATFEDAAAIAKAAKEAGASWFTSSSLRFSALAATLKFPDAAGYFVWGPGPLEEHHTLDLTWYGIHSAELLYVWMGRGCQEVTRTFSDGADVTSCRWKDGRIGTMRVNRPYSEFGGVAFRPKEIVRSSPAPDAGYSELMQATVRFFQTGQTPVPPEETLEIFAFLEAAQSSKEAGGRPVRVRDISY